MVVTTGPAERTRTTQERPAQTKRERRTKFRRRRPGKWRQREEATIPHQRRQPAHRTRCRPRNLQIAVRSGAPKLLFHFSCPRPLALFWPSRERKNLRGGKGKAGGESRRRKDSSKKRGRKRRTHGADLLGGKKARDQRQCLDKKRRTSKRRHKLCRAKAETTKTIRQTKLRHLIRRKGKHN